MQQLCDALHVTANAVRQRLGRLQAAGFVERQARESHGRGRPGFTYRVSEAGQRQLGDNYSDLATILWREIQIVECKTTRQQLMSRVKQALAEEYGSGIAPTDQLDRRVIRLRNELEERGFHVEADTAGELPILRETNCPYLDLAETDSSICELEQSVFEQVLGAEVELTQRCLDGHQCCEFTIREKAG